MSIPDVQANAPSSITPRRRMQEFVRARLEVTPEDLRVAVVSAFGQDAEMVEEALWRLARRELEDYAYISRSKEARAFKAIVNDPKAPQRSIFEAAARRLETWYEIYNGRAVSVLALTKSQAREVAEDHRREIKGREIHIKALSELFAPVPTAMTLGEFFKIKSNKEGRLLIVAALEEYDRRRSHLATG